MASLVKSFFEFIAEEKHPDFPEMERSDIEELENVGLLPKKPLAQRLTEFEQNFERIGEISDAIRAFDEAVEQHYKKTFSQEERNSEPLRRLIRWYRNDANSIEEKLPLSDYSWFQWWITH